jgi:hypothetical protein
MLWSGSCSWNNGKHGKAKGKLGELPSLPFFDRVSFIFSISISIDVQWKPLAIQLTLPKLQLLQETVFAFGINPIQ